MANSDVTFLKFKKIDVGLLFVEQVTLHYPNDLYEHHDPVWHVTENPDGSLNIETKNFVYIQGGQVRKCS